MIAFLPMISLKIWSILINYENLINLSGVLNVVLLMMSLIGLASLVVIHAMKPLLVK